MITPAVQRACAIFLPRAILGFVYLFAGIHKLTDVGAMEFGQRMVALSDATRFLPGGVVLAVGAVTPFLELTLGLLLLIGLWTRPALRALAALVVFITAAYGVDGLLHPVGATAMSVGVVNTFILPRAALLFVTLLLPAEDDLLSVDALIASRSMSYRSTRLA